MQVSLNLFACTPHQLLGTYQLATIPVPTLSQLNFSKKRPYLPSLHLHFLFIFRPTLSHPHASKISPKVQKTSLGPKSNGDFHQLHPDLLGACNPGGRPLSLLTSVIFFLLLWLFLCSPLCTLSPVLNTLFFLLYTLPEHIHANNS